MKNKKIVSMLVAIGIVLTGFQSPNIMAAQTTTHVIDGSRAQIGLSFEQSSKQLFKGTEYSVKYIDNIYGTEQIVQISAGDSNEFSVIYNVSGGGKLSSAFSDGSLLIYDNNEQLVGAVDSIRIEDFWGREVKAKVSASDTKATYTLNYNDVTFPLTARIQVYGVDDFNQWFKSGSWGINDGRVSLMLVPTSGWHGLGSSTGVVTWSWNTVKNKFSNDYRWTNEQGLSEQFQCHVLGASYKASWNLEPSRPCVGIVETIRKECNPE